MFTPFLEAWGIAALCVIGVGLFLLPPMGFALYLGFDGDRRREREAAASVESVSNETTDSSKAPQSQQATSTAA